MSGPNFTDIARTATSLENAAAISTTAMILTGEGEPARLDVAAEVSASLFNVLRVRPALGRAFNADENTPGRTEPRHPVARRSGSSGSAATRRHRPADHARRRAARGGRRHAARLLVSRRASEAWLPIGYDESFVSKQRGAWYLSVVARLKPGVTPEQSAAEVETLGRNLARQYPDANADVGMTTYPLHEAMVGDIRALRADPARRGRASSC